MRKIVVNVDAEKANALERINLELNLVKDVIQRIIEAHPNDTDVIMSPTFKAYQKQAVDLQAEYSIASKEVEDLYIPEKLKGHQINWTIPNNSTEMTINILCDCEIEGI